MGRRRSGRRGLATGLQRARSERAGGFVAAAYRHRMSRAQDPQLHTHVVCANMRRGPTGGGRRWTARCYEHGKAGGVVYEAHLRQAVRERLAWAEWGAVRRGSRSWCRSRSGCARVLTRRQRILEREAELEAAGVSVGHRGASGSCSTRARPSRRSTSATGASGWGPGRRSTASAGGARRARGSPPAERPVSAERLAERCSRWRVDRDAQHVS